MDISSSNTATGQSGFGTLLHEVRRSRILILSVALLAGIAGVASTFVMDKQYDATTVMAPVEEQTGTGALSSLAERFGGLAALAGFSLPDQGAKKQEAIAVLQSEVLTEHYIQSNDLLPILYDRQWDSATRKWKTRDPASVPSLWKANRLWKSTIRDVTEDKRTGLVTLRIRWKDPRLAAKWANDLVRLTNEYLRDKAINEAERNIAYLNDQASKTTVVEARRAIYSLLEQELNKEMLARGRPEYALSVLDPAFIPERPSSFGKTIRGLLGFIVGVFFALVFITLRHLWRVS